MKIALCLSGHFRSFSNTKQSLLRHLNNLNDVDVFISTWKDLGLSTAYKKDNYSNLNTNIEYLFKDILNPKLLVVEDNSIIAEYKRKIDIAAPHLMNVPKHPSNMWAMFYKIFGANELCKSYALKNNINYDYVIRSRPDLIYFTDLINDIKSDHLNVARMYSSHNWTCDQIAVANPEIMDIYANAVHHVIDYLAEGKEYYPEKFLFNYLHQFNIPINYSNWNFQIKR